MGVVGREARQRQRKGRKVLGCILGPAQGAEDNDARDNQQQADGPAQEVSIAARAKPAYEEGYGEGRRGKRDGGEQ